MTLDELLEAEGELDFNGHRVRFSAGSERDGSATVDYLPPISAEGVSLEEARKLAERLARVARLKNLSNIEVVGPELEPVVLDAGATIELSGKDWFSHRLVVERDSSSLPFLPGSTVTTSPLELAGGPPGASVVSAKPVSKADWQLEHERKMAALPEAVRRFLQSNDKINAAVLVNPEALAEGLSDSDD